jgi:hypothetical protein
MSARVFQHLPEIAMKLFECQFCGQPLYFANVRCESCGHRLGFVAEDATLSALDPAGTSPQGERWRLVGAGDRPYRFCLNAERDACNWLVPADEQAAFCEACRHNHVIPDLSDTTNVERWRTLEIAKHHLFYSILRFGLPHQDRTLNPQEGLAFDFLSEQVGPDGTVQKILTGHDNGLITINTAEADPAEREKLRSQMSESYRTVLGHFRHEVGHYYWDRLVRDGGRLEDFRAIFGDERRDYGEALQEHYRNGPPGNWQQAYVSAYATTHPWEDWAETFAHYLHIVDTLETASAFGLSTRPRIRQGEDLSSEVSFDPYRAPDIERLMKAWLPLTFAVNSLNRSMGQPDLYPFVLSPEVVRKLGFVRDVIAGGTQANLQAVA